MKFLCGNKKVLKKLYYDENGFSFSVLFLIMFPILIFWFSSSTEIKRTERTTTQTLQMSIDKAVRSATSMIDLETMAHGTPMIEHKGAIEQFKEQLFYNLNLLESGKGHEGSSITDKIKYWVLIYNGDSSFSGYQDKDIKSYAFYTNERGISDEIANNLIKGFPLELGIDNSGISDYLSQRQIKVTINEPSIVAVVQAKINPATGIDGEPQIVTRWAKGTIKIKEDLIDEKY